MKRNFFVFSVIQAIIFCFSCRLFCFRRTKGQHCCWSPFENDSYR